LEFDALHGHQFLLIKIGVSFMKMGILILTLLTACNSFGQGNAFEGIVHFRFLMDGHAQTMRYLLKPGYQRVESGEGADAIVVIFDFNAQKSYVLMNADQSYMEELLNLPDPESASKDVQGTGKTLTIAGFVCKQWMVNDSAGSHEVCLNDQLGGFVSMDFRMRQSGEYSGFERLVATRFPLRLITNGKLQFEVTKIEQKNLDKKLFNPPAGFEKISLP